MDRIDGQPVYSATDLVAYLACEHLTQLERAALAGLVKRPMRDDPELDVIRRRGFQHEARFLADLRAEGRASSRSRGTGRPPIAATRCVPRRRATIEAMASGRRRHLPGDVLRWHLSRTRGLPPPGRRRRIARRCGGRTTTRWRTRSWHATSRRAPSSRSARTSTSSSGSRASGRSGSTSRSAGAREPSRRCASTTTWPTTGAPATGSWRRWPPRRRLPIRRRAPTRSPSSTATSAAGRPNASIRRRDGRSPQPRRRDHRRASGGR